MNLWRSCFYEVFDGKINFLPKNVVFANSRYLLDFSLYHQNQNTLLSLRIYLGDFDDIIYAEFKELLISRNSNGDRAKRSQFLEIMLPCSFPK